MSTAPTPPDHKKARNHANSVLRMNSIDPGCTCGECNAARAYLDLSSRAEAFLEADAAVTLAAGHAELAKLDEAERALRACLLTPESRAALKGRPSP